MPSVVAEPVPRHLDPAQRQAARGGHDPCRLPHPSLQHRPDMGGGMDSRAHLDQQPDDVADHVPQEAASLDVQSHQSGDPGNPDPVTVRTGSCAPNLAAKLVKSWLPTRCRAAPASRTGRAAAPPASSAAPRHPVGSAVDRRVPADAPACRRGTALELRELRPGRDSDTAFQPRHSERAPARAPAALPLRTGRRRAAPRRGQRCERHPHPAERPPSQGFPGRAPHDQYGRPTQAHEPGFPLPVRGAVGAPPPPSAVRAGGAHRRNGLRRTRTGSGPDGAAARDQSWMRHATVSAARNGRTRESPKARVSGTDHDSRTRVVVSSDTGRP